MSSSENILFLKRYMNKKELSELILGDDPAKVQKWHNLFKDPAFIPKYNMDWEETRDRPY